MSKEKNTAAGKEHEELSHMSKNILMILKMFEKILD